MHGQPSMVKTSAVEVVTVPVVVAVSVAEVVVAASAQQCQYLSSQVTDSDSDRHCSHKSVNLITVYELPPQDVPV